MKSIIEYRIKAVAIDYFIMVLIGFLLYVLTNDLLLSMLITYPMAMNKDFLNGKSIGKRLFGIQVQDLNNNKATEWNCSLRNFLLIIPIEFLIIFLSPTRRIGD